MKHILPLSALLLLVACAPVAPGNTSGTSSDAARVMAGKGIMIRMEKIVTEDEQATTHTKATLHVTGVVEKDIDLGDILGDLVFVDPTTYPVYAEQELKPETIAIFTAWWAGQGEEIQVQMHEQNLIVMQRYGDEEGTCTEWKEIAKVPLGQDVVVEWEGVGESTVEASSIAFCDKK